MSKALLRYIRLSPTKARLIAREIQGMNAELAIASLEFTPNKAARIISKVLASAVANGGYDAQEVVEANTNSAAQAAMKKAYDLATKSVKTQLDIMSTNSDAYIEEQERAIREAEAQIKKNKARENDLLAANKKERSRRKSELQDLRNAYERKVKNPASREMGGELYTDAIESLQKKGLLGEQGQLSLFGDSKDEQLIAEEMDRLAHEYGLGYHELQEVLKKESNEIFRINNEAIDEIRKKNKDLANEVSQIMKNITGYKNAELRYFYDGKTIQPSKAVVVGARSIDDWEKENIRYSGITVFTTEDIKQKGIEQVVEEAFKIAGEKTSGIHISYDLDLIDPEVAPGVSIPEFDGISEEEAMKINELIMKHLNQVVSYDLVEFNPLRDVNRKTEQIALNLLAQIIRAVENKGKVVEKKY